MFPSGLELNLKFNTPSMFTSTYKAWIIDLNFVPEHNKIHQNVGKKFIHSTPGRLVPPLPHK